MKAWYVLDNIPTRPAGVIFSTLRDLTSKGPKHFNIYKAESKAEAFALADKLNELARAKIAIRSVLDLLAKDWIRNPKLMRELEELAAGAKHV